jgi:hypothetical protein
MPTAYSGMLYVVRRRNSVIARFPGCALAAAGLLAAMAVLPPTAAAATQTGRAHGRGATADHGDRGLAFDDPCDPARVSGVWNSAVPGLRSVDRASRLQRRGRAGQEARRRWPDAFGFSFFFGVLPDNRFDFLSGTPTATTSGTMTRPVRGITSGLTRGGTIPARSPSRCIMYSPTTTPR